MTTTSRFPVPKLDDLPADVREHILAVQEKSGFIPNVFIGLARRPDEFRAFFAYYDALMLRDSGLTKGDKEMIVVATSKVNECLYCVVSHGALLRIYEKKPLVADQVAVNYRKADITPRQRAMLDFALKVCSASATVADARSGTVAEAGPGPSRESIFKGMVSKVSRAKGGNALEPVVAGCDCCGAWFFRNHGGNSGTCHQPSWCTTTAITVMTPVAGRTYRASAHRSHRQAIRR